MIQMHGAGPARARSPGGRGPPPHASANALRCSCCPRAPCALACFGSAAIAARSASSAPSMSLCSCWIRTPRLKRALACFGPAAIAALDASSAPSMSLRSFLSRRPRLLCASACFGPMPPPPRPCPLPHHTARTQARNGNQPVSRLPQALAAEDDRRSRASLVASAATHSRTAASYVTAGPSGRRARHSGHASFTPNLRSPFTHDWWYTRARTKVRRGRSRSPHVGARF